jgi:hypothetical protein
MERLECRFLLLLVFFLFAVALYNLWMHANILVGGEIRPEKPPISTWNFRRLILTDYG